MVYFDKLKGRWFVYNPKHPNSSIRGYVKRARIIIEKQLGRYLKIGEVVHHIDGDKTNDNISNLRLMKTEEHISHHHAGLRKPR